MCARVRLDRFHHDFLANDYTEAVLHFDEATKANLTNQEGWIGLARLYAEVGEYLKSSEAIAQALKLEENENLRSLYKMIEEHQGESVEFVDDALMEIESRRGLTPTGLEMRKIFEPSPRGGTVLEISPMKVEQFLSKYTSIPGYKCSGVLTQDGQLIAVHSQSEVGKEKFASITQQIMSSVLNSSKMMDLGSFVGGEIETRIGRIVLASWKNAVLAFLVGSTTKKEDLTAAVDRFIGFAAVR